MARAGGKGRRSGPPANRARDDVGDFAPAPVRNGLRLSTWAKETLESLPGDDSPRAQRQRAAEQKEDWTERAAILEYLGLWPRADAERMATSLVYG